MRVRRKRSASPTSDDAPDERTPEEISEDQKFIRQRHKIAVIRSYVLIGVGVLLVVYSLIPPIHPAALTLGGGMIGFSPVVQSAAGGADSGSSI